MITIIGAGPSGSYLAYLLAKQGQEVVIIENHNTVGKPVQCTGIVTHSIENFFKLPDKVIAKRLNKVVVISKNKRISVDVDEIVMWRDRFDQFVNDMAVKEGAKLLLSHEFIGIDGKNSIIVKDRKTNSRKTLKTDIIVGADGPYSAVAKAVGLDFGSRNYIGMQAKVNIPDLDADAFETYFGEDFPNFFGWVVPESDDVARLGIGCLENAQHYFYKFLEKRTGKKEIICWESGLIPLFNPNKVIQKDDAYLIGDAASQAKATTGGGIIPSLKAARTLADCIINNKDYNKEFRKNSGKELSLHLRIRNILNKFTDDDYDRLIGLMGQEKVRKVLKKHDRDAPIALVKELLLKEPRLLYFGKKLF